MNKRKAKKRRKQQEHELQVCVETVSRLPELIENIGRVILDCFKQYRNTVHETLYRIKTMPDDEFEQFCQKLDPQQISLARRIRMKGRDANDQEKSNT